LQSIKAQVLLIMAKEDLIVQRDCIPLVKEAIPKLTYVEIDSLLGHCICCSGYDREANIIMDGAIAKFLAKLR
jgi:hypothetical protein